MDYRVCEPSRIVVTARRDLKVVERTERGRAFFFVEDPLRNKYFRMGAAEYAVFAAFDGRRTVAAAVAEAASQRLRGALTIEEGLAFAKWAVDAGLASTDATVLPDRVDRAIADRRRSRRAGASIWFFRLSLGNPERWLKRLAPIGEVVFHRTFLKIWGVAIGAALWIVVADWSRIVASSPIELGWGGMLRLMAAWCLLKLVHETAHGLACRNFGGRVGDVGIAFVLGVPSPFVDVSSAWRMPNKWHRIVVSLAGVYVELLFAAVAVFIWSYFTDPVLRQLAISIAVVAGISTLAFNLNPLMRFDGYFALSDWAEVPNLSVVAREEWARLWRRYALGLDEPRAAGASRPRWVVWYGAAALAWRIVVGVSLMTLALARFGPTACVVFGVVPLGVAAIRSLRRRASCKSAKRPLVVNRRRLVVTYGVASIAAIALVAAFDPCVVRLPAVVEYEPLTIVRASTPGFVRRVLFVDGQEVVAGQRLAELQNEEVSVEAAQTESAIEQSLARSRMHRQAGEIAKEQAEATRRKALEVKLAELRRRIDELVVCAPVGGRIVSRGAALLEGRWLAEGGEIASLGDETRKSLIAAVEQIDASLVSDRTVYASDARLGPFGRAFPVDVKKLEPRAVRELPHPALSVEHGGPLPVRRRAENQSSESEKQTFVAELVEPHFRLRADMDPEQARHAAAGRTATLRLRTTWQGVARRYWSRLTRWFEDQANPESTSS